MREIQRQVARFQRMHAWANRILRVDLSSMQIEAQPIGAYVPQYLGGRGIAARLCWEAYPEAVEPLAPASPLMVFPGALTGSRAPYSGRTAICAFAPQGYPHPWFTRSSVGGYFGGALKRAGYDGIVVTGASDDPVRIDIRDDEVRVLPASDLWGLDTAETLEAIASSEGRGVRCLVIGPAGERLSRIATIHAALASACGQGGLGAVMGSKQLKAISVTGSGQVSSARPETVRSIARTLARAYVEDELAGPLNFYGDIAQYNRELAAAGDGSARCHACTEGCITPCAAYMQDVPGAVHDRAWSGGWVCVGTRFEGFPTEDSTPLRAVYDWQLPRRAAFEMSVLSNRYGLNQADLIGGMVPWLIACQKAGLISGLNGHPMDWSSPTFWDRFLHAIAYREGIGDVLAEGGWAAARQLHLGEDLARRRYPGWGYGAHCDGREGGRLVYPYWIVSALQWLADTRDPFGSGHGYLWAAAAADRAASLEDASARASLLDRARAIGERVYRSADAVDPYSGYEGKAFPGYYQTIRAVVKDCLPADAHFPLIYREQAPDGYWRLSDVEGIGTLEGPAIEYRLFAAGTGVDWSEEEFELAAARVCALERALQVRHWGRDRQMDESILPYFEQVELYQSAYHQARYALDRCRFAPVIDAFYALHGWDRERGWPTQARLEELGIPDVYAPMLQGAAQAQAAHERTEPRNQRVGPTRGMQQ